MNLDAALSVAHWWVVIALVVVLATEMVRCRGDLDQAAVRALAQRDGLYGGLSVLLLLVGSARVVYGAKGWDFYAGNPAFWVKIGLFALIGLLSIVPTLRFMRWRKETAGGGLIDAARTTATRWWIHAEMTVLMLIPIAAALMARGIGY